jgi:hypothetical protein
LPRRVLQPDADECFDDWCIGVAEVKQHPDGAGIAYDVALRLGSRARRVSQRENNLAVYLTDDRSSRYDPVGDVSAEPFNVLLGPGESVIVHRRFSVPATRGLGLVAAHEGGFPIGWFIIGYDTWFRKPTVIRLQR